jgi:hypothetical protein
MYSKLVIDELCFLYKLVLQDDEYVQSINLNIGSGPPAATISVLDHISVLDMLATLVTSLVFVRLDYCNVVLAGLPSSELYRLQGIQNTAARLVA